ATFINISFHGEGRLVPPTTDKTPPRSVTERDPPHTQPGGMPGRLKLVRRLERRGSRAGHSQVLSGDDAGVDAVVGEYGGPQAVPPDPQPDEQHAEQRRDDHAAQVESHLEALTEVQPVPETEEHRGEQCGPADATAPHLAPGSERAIQEE